MTGAMLGNILSGTLTMATPLLLAALGENVVQKSGVVNVGLEGLMLTGALTAIIGAQQFHSPLLGVATAALAGMMIALIFAIFCRAIGGKSSRGRRGRQPCGTGTDRNHCPRPFRFAG